jgi:hypothetical protein
MCMLPQSPCAPGNGVWSPVPRCSSAVLVGYHAVCIVGVMAIIATFPELMRRYAVRVMLARVSLHIPLYQLVRPCWLVGEPWALLSASGQLTWGGGDTKHRARWLLGPREDKGDGIYRMDPHTHSPAFLHPCLHLLSLILSFQIITTNSDGCHLSICLIFTASVVDIT